MRLPFLKKDRPITVRLHIDLGFDSSRLGHLIQLLAREDAILRDLMTDRDLESELTEYHFGMPERFAEVTLLVANPAHKDRVLKRLLTWASRHESCPPRNNLPGPAETEKEQRSP